MIDWLACLAGVAAILVLIGADGAWQLGVWLVVPPVVYRLAAGRAR